MTPVSVRELADELRPAATALFYLLAVQVEGEPMLSSGQLLASAFGIAAIMGVSALARSSRKLTARNVFAAFFYNGGMGLIVGMASFKEYREENPMLLLSICGVVGLAGLSALELLGLIAKNSPVKIRIESKSGEMDTK
jgi:FtsH-binding integral membrane protein